MLRVKAIAPLLLDDQEVERRQARYNRLSGAELSVTLVNLQGDDAPRRLDGHGEIEQSAMLVRAEIERTDPRRFDAILPDCVLDPCVREIPEGPVPLYGILHLSCSVLTALSAKFGAVTRNSAIGTELGRKLELYGLGHALASTQVLDVDFCLISDQRGWGAAMAPLMESAARSGISILVNGCSAVDVEAQEGLGVRLVDPTAMALRTLASAHGAGLIGSRGVAPDRAVV